VINTVEEQRGKPIPALSSGRRRFIISKSQLQARLASGLREKRFQEFFGTVSTVIEHPRWKGSDNPALPYTMDIPDLVLLTEKVMSIVELKKGHIGLQTVHQVCRYLDNPEAEVAAGPRRLQGIVIGYHLLPKVDAALLTKIHKSGRIRVLTYARTDDGDLSLSEVGNG
jgi:hypothetical protein